MPKVSVIMATYNHGAFVAESIRSVLSQDGVDFEFLIADDGSSDDTREVVATFDDPRIHFTPNLVNRGACVVTNELIARSRGEYVALLNSDDAWEQGKLVHQLEILEKNPRIGASFTDASFVDRDSVPIPAETLAFGTIFTQKNRSSGRWLRRFFDEGNCLCHPSILIRRRCYEELGTYSNRLRQLPDFDMWIRLVKSYEIHVSDRKLLRFRVLPGENASSQTPTNAVRTMNEHFLIAETFFEDVSRDLMIEAFSDCLKNREIPTTGHLEIEKALAYFREVPWLDRAYLLVGLMQMNRLLNDESTRVLLERDYRIDDRWFQREMGRVDVLRPIQPEAPTFIPPLTRSEKFRKTIKRNYKRLLGKS